MGQSILKDREGYGISPWSPGQRDFDFVTSDAFRKLLQENHIKLITWREVGKLIANAAN